MINNLIAFIQWSIFALGLLLIAAVCYVGSHHRKIADVSFLHCAAMIQGETELMQRQADLQIRENDLRLDRIELDAERQSLPVCKKK